MSELADRLRNTTAVIMERFEDTLSRVVENISDVNTKPDAVRTITITVKVKPTIDRCAAAIEVSCAPKLAPVAPYPMTLYIGKDKAGKPAAFESDQSQMSIFEDETKTIPMPGRSVIG